jgi:hypothetical protein
MTRKRQLFIQIPFFVMLTGLGDMYREERTYLICLTTDHLWKAYSPDDNVLTEVKAHLVKMRWLSGEGKWDSFSGEKIDRRQFTTPGEDSHEPSTFSFFSRLFNVVLDYLRKGGRETPVERMVYAGPSETVSTGSSAHRPDAFLHMVTQTSPPPGKMRRRNLTCPFEYKLRTVRLSM